MGKPIAFFVAIIVIFIIMRSKFRFPAYLVSLMAIVILFMSVGVFSGKVLNRNMSLGPFLIACLFFLFVFIWIFFGEVRTKTISLSVENGTFIVKGYLSLGIAREYNLNEIAGYRLSVLSSKSGSYEYLYLIVGEKKIAKLSEFYHSNYRELKSYIISMKIKNLGFERFSNRQELKDIFLS